MASIRWKPKYIIQPQSPEVKKTILRFRGGKIQLCCNNPKIKYNLLDGGTPSARGSAIKDGGTPSAGGPQRYDGGKP
jgi:hypothetical protein